MVFVNAERGLHVVRRRGVEFEPNAHYAVERVPHLCNDIRLVFRVWRRAAVQSRFNGIRRNACRQHCNNCQNQFHAEIVSKQLVVEHCKHRPTGTATKDLALSPTALFCRMILPRAMPQITPKRFAFDCGDTLLPAFLQIAHAAQHLAVGRYRMATLRPWLDVVGLHLLYLEVLAAYRANPLLPLVCGPRHLV